MSRRQDSSALAILAFLLVAGTVSGDENAPSQPEGWFNFGVLSVLGRSDVREELELLDDQHAKIREIIAADEMQFMNAAHAFSQVILQRKNDPKLPVPRNPGEFLREERKKRVREALAVLLPHQIKRLRQLTFQRPFMISVATGWKQEDVAATLSLNADQSPAFLEMAKEEDAWAAEQLAKIREEAVARFVRRLPPQQQHAFRETYGEPYPFVQREGSGTNK